MKKSLSMLSCALLITTAFAFFATNAVASEPEIGFPEDDGGFVSGTGRCFEVTDSTYLNVTLCSSEVVNVTLRSVPKVVSFTIRTETSALPTDIDMSGFESGKTHYRYEDGHLVESFTADEEGNHSYTQDLSKPHHVFIQEESATLYIRDDATGGDCTSIGRWDRSTLTCRLTSDVYEEIVIDSDGITLDGDGHSITGEEYGMGWVNTGVYASHKSWITIKDVTVSWPTHEGIILFGGSNNRIIGNTILVDRNFQDAAWVGIYVVNSNNNIISFNTVASFDWSIYMVNSQLNTITDNTVSDADVAINLHFSDSNTVSGNVIPNWGYGIVLLHSAGNMVHANTISPATSGEWQGRCDTGIKLRDSNLGQIGVNSITGCTYGINVDPSSGNTISGNTISGCTYGIYVHYSSGNFIFHNNLIGNTYQVFSYESTNTWDDGSGEGSYWNDYQGEDLDGDGVGDTELPHQGMDWYPLVSPWYPAPVDAAEVMKQYVEVQIPQETGKSLISQLNAVENTLSNGQEKAAVNILNAFIKHVKALLGADRLTEEQAEYLILSAEGIITMIAPSPS